MDDTGAELIPKEPMSEIIAANASEITLPDGRIVPVYVSVARPAPSGEDWGCELRIRVADDDFTHPLLGADSLQALEGAAYLLRQEFRALLVRCRVVGGGSILRNLTDSEAAERDGPASAPGVASVKLTMNVIGERDMELPATDGSFARLAVALTAPTSVAPDDWSCELRVRIAESDNIYPIQAANSLSCLSLALRQLHADMRAIAGLYPIAASLVLPE